jgi:cytochrome P450
MPLAEDRVVFDPFAALMAEDPYPTYSWLRAHEPVHHNPDRDIWAVAKYKDVQAVSRDWNTFTVTAGVDPDDRGRILGINSLLEHDPPGHDVMRKILRPFFVPAAIKKLQGALEEIISRELADLRSRTEGDLAIIAHRVPHLAICTLLGIPHQDSTVLTEILAEVGTRTEDGHGIPPEAYAGHERLQAYLNKAIEEHRAPTDNVLGAITAAEGDGLLTRAEAINMAGFLFFAGSETPGSLVANTFYLMANDRSVREWIEARPDATAQTLEEVLRYEAPIQHLSRVSNQEVKIRGVTIPAGSRIFLLYGSANRDEEVYDRADELVLDRPRFRHLAFGEGVHFCIGAPLARLESRLLVDAVTEALPPWELNGEITRAPLAENRGVKSLPVSWG